MLATLQPGAWRRRISALLPLAFLLQSDRPLRYALDAKTAEALWKKSEELVGESF